MRTNGSTFVRAIQTVLRPIHDFTSSYVDDMATGSKNWPEHLIHINAEFVKIRICEARSKICWSICWFGISSPGF